MGWDWLVTVVLGLHFGYVAYVVLGGFLAWKWPKAFWPHLVACVWGVLIAFGRVDCPLTWAEREARRLAGQSQTVEGFVDRFFDNVIYHEDYVWLMQLGIAVLVAFCWAGAYWRYRRHHRGSYRNRDNLGADTPADSEASSDGAVTV